MAVAVIVVSGCGSGGLSEGCSRLPVMVVIDLQTTAFGAGDGNLYPKGGKSEHGGI